MESFFTILAWIFLFLSGGMFIIRILGGRAYAKHPEMQMLDQLRGLRRTFPITGPVLMFSVCVAWLWK